MAPFISVIVPCFKQAQYLEAALTSVIRQSLDDWECIIVNDGSPDHTEEIARKWCDTDRRFHYLSQPNAGLASARNLGISAAKGSYLQFLDADDLLETDKFKAHKTHLDDTIDISIAGYRYFNDGDAETEQRIMGIKNFTPEVYITKNDRLDLCHLLSTRNIFVVCSPVYKAELVRKLGGFDESLFALEDWFLNLRCALIGARFDHFGYPPNSKALVRLHSTSMSQNPVHMQENFHRFQRLCSSLPEYTNYFGHVSDLQHQTARFKTIIKYLCPPFVVDLAKTMSNSVKSG